MSPLRRLLRLVALFLIGLSLFWPAGTVAWPQAWMFFIEFIGGMLVTMAWLKRHDPDLYNERVKVPGRSTTPRWERLFGLTMMLSWYGWIVFMAFDHRFGLSAMPVALAVPGVLAILAGYLFVASALKANSFASTIVRLQPERGQRVIDTGPYAFVRHPMYTGSVIIHIGTALLLGSWIGLALVMLLSALVGIRAVLEERLLSQGLPGYREYAARVRWRLIPGLW